MRWRNQTFGAVLLLLAANIFIFVLYTRVQKQNSQREGSGGERGGPVYGICDGPFTAHALQFDVVTEMLIEHAVRNVSQEERFCPCCGTHFVRPFRDFRGRRDSQCPVCKTRERQRAVCLLLPQLLVQQTRVLMFAPQDMEQLIEKYTHRHIQLTTADLYQEGVDVRADIQALPFADNTFDLILNSHVMEHIPNDLIAFSEQYRVLKWGSLVLFQAPITFSRNRTIDRSEVPAEELRKWHKDHVRDYGGDFLDRAQSAGFQCTVFSIQGALPSFPPTSIARLLHLIGATHENSVLCRKCNH